MDVLKRLALVFHVLSFVIGVAAFIGLMTSGVIDNSKNDIWYFLSAPVALFVLNGFGWTIRFIFEGKTSFIPFSFKSMPQVPPKYLGILSIVLIIIAGSAYLIDRNTILQNAKNAEIKLAIQQEEATLAAQESAIRLNQARINRAEADERIERLDKARSERLEKAREEREAKDRQRLTEERERKADERRRTAEANKVKDWRSLQCNVTNTLKNRTNAPSAFSFILKKSESNPFPAAIEWLDYSNKVGIMRSKKLDTYCAKNGFGTPHMSCSSNLIEKVGDIFKFRLEFTDWRYTEYPGGSISQVVSLDLKNYTYVFDGIASGRCYDRSPDTIRAWAN